MEGPRAGTEGTIHQHSTRWQKGREGGRSCPGRPRARELPHVHPSTSTRHPWPRATTPLCLLSSTRTSLITACPSYWARMPLSPVDPLTCPPLTPLPRPAPLSPGAPVLLPTGPCTSPGRPAAPRARGPSSREQPRTRTLSTTSVTKSPRHHLRVQGSAAQVSPAFFETSLGHIGVVFLLGSVMMLIAQYVMTMMREDACSFRVPEVSRRARLKGGAPRPGRRRCESSPDPPRHCRP